jgi:hypothetical protein
MFTRDVTLPRPRRFSRLPNFDDAVALSMPLARIVGRPFRPFSRANSPRCSPTTYFSAATSPNSSSSKASSSGPLRPESEDGGGTSPQRIDHPEPEQEKNHTMATLLPLLRFCVVIRCDGSEDVCLESFQALVMECPSQGNRLNCHVGYFWQLCI